jgi:hypothetical protein
MPELSIAMFCQVVVELGPGRAEVGRGVDAASADTCCPELLMAIEYQPSLGQRPGRAVVLGEVDASAVGGSGPRH